MRGCKTCIPRNTWPGNDTKNASGRRSRSGPRPGRRAPQAGEAAGARRAPAAQRVAARRAAPLADERQAKETTQPRWNPGCARAVPGFFVSGAKRQKYLWGHARLEFRRCLLRHGSLEPGTTYLWNKITHMTTKTRSQSPVKSASAGSAKEIPRRIAALLAQRRWLLVSVGTVGGLLAVIVLLIAVPGSSTKSTVQPQADNATGVSAQPDSSGVAVIPGSQATAAMPSGSASAAKSAAANKPGAKARTTAGAKLVPTASTSKGAVAIAGTTVSAPKVSGGTITTGNSKANCVNASFPMGC